MVTIKTFSFRDRQGVERGAFYLSEKDSETYRREWHSLEEMRGLKDRFSKAGNKNFEHVDFLLSLRKELSGYIKDTEFLIKIFENSKRHSETNEMRMLKEISSLIEEIDLLSQKSEDEELLKILDIARKRLQIILAEEKEDLKQIRYDQRRLAHERIPKKTLLFQLSSGKKGFLDENEQNLPRIMFNQHQEAERYKEQSQLYPEIRHLVLELAGTQGIASSARKKESMNDLSAKLKNLLDSYRNSFSNDFRIDTKVDFEEFRKLDYIKEVSDFVDKVYNHYSSLLSSEHDDEGETGLKHIAEFRELVSYFHDASDILKEYISELTYWAQQDFTEDKFLLNKDSLLIKRLGSGFKKMHPPTRGDFELKVDRLDDSLPCYHIRFYEDMLSDDGEWEKTLSANVLVGSSPDVVQKMMRKNPGQSLQDIVPAQIYIPSLEVDELSDNTSIQFPYRIHRYHDSIGQGTKVDIVGYPEDVDVLREKIFYSIYVPSALDAPVSERPDSSQAYKNFNIDEEINFIKVQGEYTFKTPEQIRRKDNSVGRSSLKVVQEGGNLHLYAGRQFLRRLSVGSKPSREKLLKRLSDVQKNSHWINRSRKMRCFVLGSGNPYSSSPKGPLDKSCSKILHFARTNIWIDPVGRPVESLLDENIHPDVIDALVLTSLDEERCAGFGSFLQYKRTRGSRFTLITTKELLDKIRFKFSFIFDKDENLFERFLSPLIIPEGKNTHIPEIKELDPKGKKIRHLDPGLEISALKDSGNGSYAFKFSYMGKKIAFSGKSSVDESGLSDALNPVFRELGLKGYDHKDIHDLENRGAEGIWAVAAALRQRSLTDNEKLFYNHFSSVAFQKLVDLELPAQKIATMNNSSVIGSYSDAILGWAEKQGFGWYGDCDVIVHEMGPCPGQSSPAAILELNRYLRSFSKKGFRFFVEYPRSILESFPESRVSERLAGLAEEEFEKNNIRLISSDEHRRIDI